MKTKLQVIIAVSLVVAATAGISGEYMINVPFFGDSLCLWVHYIICAFSGLFGIIWLFYVGDQNDELIRYRKDYYWSVEKNCELSAKVNQLTKQMIELKDKLAESESDKAILRDCNMILKQKYFSAQGNMAQLRNKVKYYRSMTKVINNTIPKS